MSCECSNQKGTTAKCNDTIQSVEHWMNASLMRSIANQPNSCAQLDPTKVSRDDCYHSQLVELSQRVMALGALAFQPGAIKSVPLISSIRIYPHEPFPTFASITPTNPNALYDVEEWIFGVFTAKSFGRLSIKLLFDLFELYLQTGKQVYYNNKHAPQPLGYSRLILACLAFVCSFDYMACARQPMLRQHHTGLYCELLESLVLPERQTTAFAFDINAYIGERNNASRFSSSIIDTQVNESCVSARLGAHSEACQSVKSQIETKARKKLNQKRAEVEQQRAVYQSILRQCDSLTCDFEAQQQTRHYGAKMVHKRECNRCQIRREAGVMRVQMHEWPLPADTHKCDAVLFELIMPLELSILRDALFVLRTELLNQRNEATLGASIHLWRDYSEMKPYVRNKPKYVTLGSDTKLYLHTHYRWKHPKEPAENFFRPNGYTVKFADMQTCLLDWQEDGRATRGFFEPQCTFVVDGPYAPLQVYK